MRSVFATVFQVAIHDVGQFNIQYYYIQDGEEEEEEERGEPLHGDVKGPRDRQ